MRASFFWRRVAAATLIVALWPTGTVSAAFLFAQAGALVVAPDAAAAAKPAKPVADAPAGAPPPAPAVPAADGVASGGGTNTLMKYLPSYVLMALLIGLGAFIIGRPKPRAKAE